MQSMKKFKASVSTVPNPITDIPITSRKDCSVSTHADGVNENHLLYNRTKSYPCTANPNWRNNKYQYSVCFTTC